MARRIITHREQVELASFWRPELRVAAHEAHPDLAVLLQLFGCVHTHGGRALCGHRHYAAEFNGFNDPRGWTYHTSFNPSPMAVQGAQAYSSLMGMPDPHSGGVDYLNARRTPDEMRSVAQAYDALPTRDPSAIKHFDAMRNDIGKQFDFATNRMGIRPQFVDYDPYTDVHDMLDDINNNKTLKVLGTAATGGHPYFSNAENDRFRFVHDLFGHAATGRSFDRHGEQAAYLAHAQMFTPQALPALATETRGQNSSLVFNGGFQPQKLAVLGPQHWGELPSGLTVPKTGQRRIAKVPTVNEWVQENYGKPWSAFASDPDMQQKVLQEYQDSARGDTSAADDYATMSLETAVNNGAPLDAWLDAHPNFVQNWLLNPDKPSGPEAIKDIVGNKGWDLLQDELQDKAIDGDESAYHALDSHRQSDVIGELYGYHPDEMAPWQHELMKPKPSSSPMGKPTIDKGQVNGTGWKSNPLKEMTLSQLINYGASSDTIHEWLDLHPDVDQALKNSDNPAHQAIVEQLGGQLKQHLSPANYPALHDQSESGGDFHPEKPHLTNNQGGYTPEFKQWYQDKYGSPFGSGQGGPGLWQASQEYKKHFYGQGEKTLGQELSEYPDSIVSNPDAFDSLPADMQKQLLDNITKAYLPGSDTALSLQELKQQHFPDTGATKQQAPPQGGSSLQQGVDDNSDAYWKTIEHYLGNSGLGSSGIKMDDDEFEEDPDYSNWKKQIPPAVVKQWANDPGKASEDFEKYLLDDDWKRPSAAGNASSGEPGGQGAFPGMDVDTLSGATPLTGRPAYDKLYQKVHPDPSFSNKDKDTILSHEFEKWFTNAPEDYQKVFQNHPGIVLDDFTIHQRGGPAYSSPIPEGDEGKAYGDLAPRARSKHDVPDYPYWPGWTKNPLPDYNDSGRPTLNWQQAREPGQEEIPLPPGSSWQAYAPQRLHRGLNIDLDYWKNRRQERGGLTPEEERAEKQLAEIARLWRGSEDFDLLNPKPEGWVDDHPFDKAPSSPGGALDFAKWSQGVPPEQLHDIARHWGIPEWQANDYGPAPKKTVVPGNPTHPDLGPMLLDYVENNPKSWNYVPSKVKPGIGPHWSIDEKVSKDSFTSGSSSNKIPVVVSGDWAGLGEDPDRPHGARGYYSEKEITLAPGAPVNINRVQIKHPKTYDWRDLPIEPHTRYAATLARYTPPARTRAHALRILTQRERAGLVEF